ncbi:MAG: FHA domain-containing protein [Planctomycetota bacterium]
MEAALLFFEGELAGRRVRLEQDGETLLGRGSEMDIRVGDPLVSQRHLAIRESDGRLFLDDCSSRNGTFHNGERVRERVELASGDVVSAGQLQCEIEYGLKPGDREREALVTPLEPLGTLDTREWEPLSFVEKRARDLIGGDRSEDSVPLLLMAQVVGLLITSREKADLVERSCWIFREYFDADRVIVFARDEIGEADPIAVSCRQSAVPGRGFPAALSVVYTTLSRGNSVLTHEIVPLPGEGPAGERANRVRTVVCVPIPKEGGVWGALYMEKYFEVKRGKKTFEIPHAFGDDDFNLLSLLGQILGLAVEKREAEGAILEAIEKEQQRLGRDLHDVLIQHLSGVVYISEVLERQLRTRELPEEKHASEITGLLRQAVDQARRLVEGLHPAELEKEGLASVLRDLCRNAEGTYGIPCRFRSADGEGAPSLDGLPLDAQTHLYRIAQEAVTNAVRHGKPSQIEIGLETEGADLALRVTDDGAGIPDPAGEPAGMGLRSMKYRAKMIGASLTLRRGEEGGTIVECVVKGPSGREGGGRHDRGKNIR